MQVKGLGGAWANLNSGYTDATIRALLSSSATGLTYTPATGVFYLAANYAIPLSADTAKGVSAYGWGDHAGLYTPLAHKTTEDAINGLVSVNGSGTYSAKTIGTDVQAYNSNLTGINQALDTTASPTFVGLTVSGLTSGRIPIAGTAGLLGDDGDLTFLTDTLTATKIVGTTSVTTPLATIGSVTAGGNVTVNSTETELITSPMVTGGWTLGYDTRGWSITAGVLSKTASTGTQTATAVTGMTGACVAGTKYLVTAVVSAASGTTTWTLGGTTIPSFSAAATYSYVVTAGTTAKLILSGVAASTCTITSLSVKEIGTTSGNATVENDLTAGRVLARMGSAGYPAYSFANDSDTGLYSDGASLYATIGGSTSALLKSSYLMVYGSTLYLGSAGDVILVHDAADTLGLVHSTFQQKFNLYNTYTNTSNYERFALTGVAGASGNLTMETAGTGGDNLDIVLTPAGTGSLKSATNLVHSGTPDIVSAAGAISVNTAITHVVTNGAGTVLTLAAGKEGQEKYIVLKTLTSGGQTDVVTPDGGVAGFTTITMSAVGHSVHLLYTNGKWTVVGYFGSVIA